MWTVYRRHTHIFDGVRLFSRQANDFFRATRQELPFLLSRQGVNDAAAWIDRCACAFA